MEKKRRFTSVLIIFLLLLVFITGCSEYDKIEEPKVGKYMIQNSDPEWMAWVLLEENNKFQFNRNIASSYLPMGAYSTDGNKLTLHANKVESYLFTIEEDKLIFEGNSIDNLVKKGTVFTLSTKR